MYNYSNTELFRKYFILIRGAAKGRPANFFNCISFILRYSYHLFTSNKKKKVYLNTQEYGCLWIRTRSSDLEVFFQHFIYNELVHSEITSLRDVTTILDLGANVGFATIILAKIFPGSKIIGMELEESNYEMLKLNCYKLIQSSQVELIFGAFFPRKGANLSIIAGGLGEWNFYIEENASNMKQDNRNIVIYTMDDVINRFAGKTPDFIKMDIEGGEVGFLKDDLWCKMVFHNCNLILELHTFDANDLYFHQLRKNNINMATRIGEYWMTKKLIN